MTTTIQDIHPDGRYSGVQAAKALGISRMTLWRLTKAGKLKPKVHKHTLTPRYAGKDLIAYWRAEYL